MSHRALLNIGLLVLLLALGLIAFYEPGLEGPPQAETLTALSPQDIKRIRIERQGADAIVLERKDKQWWMVKPLTVAANTVRIEGLLRVLKARSLNRYGTAALDLTRLGLDPPKARLIVDGTTIDFGITEPLNHRRYVLAGGDVHLIEDTAYYYLTGGYTGFVSNALLEKDQRPVAIRLPDRSLTLRDGSWHAEPQPPGDSADAAVLLAEAWRHAQAIEIRPYKSEGKGPFVTITLKGVKTPLRFEIVAREPDLRLGRPDLGIEYLLPPSAAADLFTLKPPAKEAAPGPGKKPQ